jgi:hypothetical protein
MLLKLPSEMQQPSETSDTPNNAAEAAIRNAAALLPNHPRPGIFRAHEGEMVQEEHIDSTDHVTQQLDGSS